MSVLINKITLVREGGRIKVQREWRENPDGTFTWRKRADMIWNIEQLNEPTQRAHRSMYSLQGWPFRATDHRVTLDDFVFLVDARCYVHLSTKSRFTARHINALIFKDQATWPARLMGPRVWPTSFMRKANRVSQSAALNEALMMLEMAHAQAA